MKYCPKCQVEVDSKTANCPYCKEPLIIRPTPGKPNEAAENIKGINEFIVFASLVVPFLGFILYFTWKEKKTYQAKFYLGIGIVSIICYVVMFIILY
ncbi:MAG TPA: hypothetical protein GXZ51_02580 [Acholeplasma sp.]|jgi:hypothetical protein|nr:hypothetical protein [Acholeplasma sp.]